jgi:nucleoside-triphosphatase THEP1
MNIIVTGKVGIGKTTVCEKVVEIARTLGYSCGGILTPKSEEGITIVDVQTGEREVLASLTDIYQGPRTGRYFFNPEGITFGIKAIDRGISSDILFVDEVGHLELKGEGFAKVMELVRAGKARNSVLVIRKELLSAFSARLGPNWLIIETNIYNRSQLPQRICTLLTGNSPAYSSRRGVSSKVPSLHQH